MKLKNGVIITIIITILILFLKYINILQIENGLGRLSGLLILIVSFSGISILIQTRIDKRYRESRVNYNNIDILKYICAILIVILHLRPFQNFSNEMDLAFNNIITRICVPMFFVITGYFSAQKEKENPAYIKIYIRKMIPLYLIWNAIYLPVLAGTVSQQLPSINSWLSALPIPVYLLPPLLIMLLPIALPLALLYTGLYYHLWYFPAVILSLLVLSKWKKKFSVKYLFLISFLFLLFGATETYYGVLPPAIRQFVSVYYSIFITSRNFLFFGLFYVVLGYCMGRKKVLYAKFCFEKLIVCIFFLIAEGVLLHDTERLNSNILLSCIPLTYYLFISIIYFTDRSDKNKFPFRNLSKYYYLIHPMVIAFCTLLFQITTFHIYIQILIVLTVTHISSVLLLKVKRCRLSALRG